MKTLIYSLLMVSLFVATSCTQNEIIEAQTVESFPVISPIKIDTVSLAEYVAAIQSVQNVEIRSKISGQLDKILIDEGQKVTEGQILFKLNSLPFQQELAKTNAQLKSALAELKLAEIELSNSQTLFNKNIVSNSELEMAKAKFNIAEAKTEEAKFAVESAKLQLSFTEIKAPFSGIINRIPFKEGSIINENSLLTSISNNKDVFAYFNVSEKEYFTNFAGKKLNQNVTLILANGEAYTEKGIIETAESEINVATGNLAIRARFPNSQLLLKHGATGKILLPTRLTNALVIPQKSTFDIQEGTYVYVLDEKNIVRTQKVSIKQRLPQLYVIADGLSESDKIIFEGIQRVKEGDVITPQNQYFNGYLTNNK